MYIFDASSIIYGWDTYPIEKFPRLWEWIESQIKKHNFWISDIALKETKYKSEECWQWLTRNNTQEYKLNNDVLTMAQRIKSLLEIEEENYHKDGVGENDILIISGAKILNFILISDENKQNNLPTNKSRYKIPAVCSLVNVSCKKFIDLVKESDESF